MRVATSGSFLRGSRLMQDIQTQLDRTQNQIATGRRILTPSDDPIAAARAVGLRESVARLEQYQRNADVAQSRLGYEESALDAVVDAMQRVRELALRANNATADGDSRAHIAIELRQQLTELVQQANRKDGSGRYLFAGGKDSLPPVSGVSGGFVYNGDEGQRFQQIGETRSVADGDSGADVFFNIRNGNGTFRAQAGAANTGTGILGPSSVIDPSAYDQGQYTIRFVDPDNYEVLDSSATVVTTGSYESGQSIEFRGLGVQLDGAPAAADEFAVQPSRYQNVFQTVLNIVESLEQGATNADSRVDLSNALNLGIQEIDVALDNLSDIRTQVGVRLSVIETQSDANNAASVFTQTTISELEDLDYAEALSRLSIQATTLEAAQKSFTLTHQLSLFQFL